MLATPAVQVLVNRVPVLQLHCINHYDSTYSISSDDRILFFLYYYKNIPKSKNENKSIIINHS